MGDGLPPAPDPADAPFERGCVGGGGGASATAAGQGAAEFLTALFRDVPAGELEITYLAPEGAAVERVTVTDPEGVPHSPKTVVDWRSMPLGMVDPRMKRLIDMNQRGYGVYVAPVVRRKRKQGEWRTPKKGNRYWMPFPRGTERDAFYIPALWTEADAKDFGGDKAEARRRVESQNPDILIDSGFGYHGYWLLDVPLEITDTNRADVKRTLRGIAIAAGVPPEVADLARIMRLPGFVNTKPGRNGAVCQIVYIKNTCRSFADLFTAYAPLVIEKPKTQRARSTYAAASDQQADVIEALSFIPADTIEYKNEWIPTLAALHSAFDDATATSIAEQWSDWCSKPGEIAAKMATFDHYSGKAAGLGTIFHIAKRFGYQRPQPTDANPPLPVVTHDQTPDRPEIDYAQFSTPAPLTLWQAARYMCVCPEFVLIARMTMYEGTAQDFTAAQLAEQAWVSVTTAQKWIDKTLRWQLVSELTANFTGIENSNPIPEKNAVNSQRGRKAVHYRLTPQLGEDMVQRRLPYHIQEIMELPDPGVIYAAEAAPAGVEDAEALELVSAAVSNTEDAWEVTARVERVAWQQSRVMDSRAELDETPLPLDEQTCSVRELRTMLIEKLIATDPERVWKHSELMWAAGTTKRNVGACLAKSRTIMPAPSPTFVKVPLEGANLHAAMQAQCRKHGGAPVAWLDAKGEVIASFGRTPPEGAVGGMLNVGKVYVQRAEPLRVPLPPDPETTKQEEMAVQEPTEEAKQKARRARARSVILPRVRGCLLAQRWRYIPGPYGYWERGDTTVPNTFEGMVKALLMDREWAQQQQRAREEMAEIAS